jgi:hypothetical protein
MYTIRTHERVLDDLTGVVVENRIHWAKRDLLKVLLKADPSLLFDVVNSIDTNARLNFHSGSLPLLSRSVRWQRRFVLDNVDWVLDRATPIVIRKIIGIFRRLQTSSFITVSPASVEQNIVYGGSSEPAHIMLWVEMFKQNDIHFAETWTRNKHSIEEIIRATHAPYRVEFDEERGMADKYEIVPTVARERVHPWSS